MPRAEDLEHRVLPVQMAFERVRGKKRWDLERAPAFRATPRISRLLRFQLPPARLESGGGHFQVCHLPHYFSRADPPLLFRCEPSFYLPGCPGR